MDLLTDTAAVITGAASGNGRAIARTFAEHGGDVVVADVRAEPRGGGKPTHELIEDGTDSRAAFVECDVTDPDDLEAAVDAADRFGGIDVMVNNAGIVEMGDFRDFDEAAYDRIMDVNAKGVFFGAQAAANRMDEGSIINVASTAGDRGGGAFAAYSASKGAVRLMTYAMADALGPGIRVNAIHPGTIETRMTAEDTPLMGTDAEERFKATIPLGEYGQPEDVAGAALYLASDLAGYVSGASLLVDGGVTTTW